MTTDLFVILQNLKNHYIKWTLLDNIIKSVNEIQILLNYFLKNSFINYNVYDI